MKTLISTLALTLYTPAAPVVTQQIVDNYAEAQHYCSYQAEPAAGQIVIEWKRDAAGRCSVPVARVSSARRRPD